MIFTSCVNCDEGFTVPLNEKYLELLKENKAMYTRWVCEKCQTPNYTEHRRIGGETISEKEFLSRGGVKGGWYGAGIQ